MFISTHAATNIVNEIGNLVQQNINLMDENGVVVASTDPKRVGKIHEGAVEIITNKLNELYVEKSSGENTMPGLNLPLIIESKIIGVIGITGLYDQVIRFGRIVQRMAEILITDQISILRINKKDQLINEFVDEWIESKGSHSANLIEKATDFNVDLTDDYAVACMMIPQRESERSSVIFPYSSDLIFDAIKVFFEKLQFLIRRKANQLLVITKSNRMTDLLANIIEWQEKFEIQYNIKITLGISNLDHGRRHPINLSVREAKAALNTATSLSLSMVVFSYNNLDLLISFLPLDILHEFVDTFFSNLESSEISDAIELADAYFNSNGSLKKCAGDLFIHPNTLQYRLNRLAAKTNRDLRKIADIPYYYLFTVGYKYLGIDTSLITTNGESKG